MEQIIPGEIENKETIFISKNLRSFTINEILKTISEKSNDKIKEFVYKVREIGFYAVIDKEKDIEAFKI